MSGPDGTRADVELLAAQLARLTDAVDRLTERIDAIAPASVALDTDPDADPFAWPSEAEIERYLAGRTRDDRP